MLALARSADAVGTLEAVGAEPVRGGLESSSTLLAAMRGCGTVFHVAGVNATCLRDPVQMLHANIDGVAAVIRAAASAGVGRVVHTSSAATIGEPEGVVAREDTAHRGWFLSDYERSKFLGERRALDLGTTLGIDVVCVNPSSVQGPGRIEGSARLLIDLVNGKLPVLVDTHLSIVDIDDCTQAHLLAETHGVRGAALPRERRVAHDTRGGPVPARRVRAPEARALRAEVRDHVRGCVRRRAHLADPPRPPPVLRGPPASSCTATATTARSPNGSSAWRTRRSRRRSGARSPGTPSKDWRRRCSSRPAGRRQPTTDPTARGPPSPRPRSGPAVGCGGAAAVRRARDDLGGTHDDRAPRPQPRDGARPRDRGRGPGRRPLDRPRRQGAPPTARPSTRCG